MPVSQPLFRLFALDGEHMCPWIELTRRDVSHHTTQRDMFGISDGQVSRPERFFVAFWISEVYKIDIDVTVDISLMALFDDGRAELIQFFRICSRLRKRQAPAGERRLAMQLIAGTDDRMMTVGLDGQTNGDA